MIEGGAVVSGSTRDAQADVAGRRYRMLIGGRLVDAEGGATRDTYDPSTGQVLVAAPEASRADVARAVDAARAAFPAWRDMPVRARTDIFHEIAAAVRERRDELALVDSVDSGNPLHSMRFDVDLSIRNILDWPGLMLGLNGETIPASPGNLHYTLHQPYGVVGKIVAFNHPGMFAMTRILAPLIAGNTVVLKPGVQTPLSALLFGEIVRDIIPPGVLNICSGGADAGDALVTHPDVKRIGFTGSAATGTLIQRRAAEHGVKHVTLELGGKNAMMVMPDADLDLVVPSARSGMNLEACQGQSCGSTSRIFVHASLHADFVERYRAELEGIRVGSAYAEDTDMGPLVSAEHLDRVTGFVRAGLEEGARLVLGGGRPDGVGAGYFLAPTIFDGVEQSMRIAREEIFGPVVSVLAWDDYEELLGKVNSVEYGLTASIWTDDLHLAHRTADRVEAGYVWINDSSKHFWGTPFGGWKSSGTGREESVEELRSYLETKAVHTILRDPAGRLTVEPGATAP